MSNEAYSQSLSIYFGMEEEATYGVDPTEATGDGVLIADGSLELRTGREMIEQIAMHGTFSELVPIMGKYDDVGIGFQVRAKGSGTVGTEPDEADALTAAFGQHYDSDGATGNIATVPTPTPTSFTIEDTPLVTAGNIVKVDYSGSGNYAYTRILTAGAPAATVAVTCWPPLPADSITGGADYDVINGNNFMLASSGHPSEHAYIYFPGGEKLRFTGLKCASAAFNFEVGQPLLIDFTFDGQAYIPTHATGTFTFNRVTEPPICLGMDLKIIYEGTIVTGSTATSIIVDGGDQDMEIAEGDYLYIYDSTETQYKYRQVASVSGSFGSNKACGVATITNIPTAGDPVFVVRNASECVQAMTVTIENELTPVECMQSSYGKADIIVTGRKVNIERTKYFRSMYDLLAKDSRIVGTELWLYVGSTDGNRMVGCVPNFVRQEVEINTGDRLVGQTETGGAYYDGTNDGEFYFAYL